MKFRFHHLFTALILLIGIHRAVAQGTEFAYQGQLQNDGSPANGTFNMTFSIFNTSSGGSPIAGPVTISGVTVTNGLFTVLIDFGAGVFNGLPDWLELGVETNGENTFTTLAPRQLLAPVPYAIFANSANTASNLDGVLPASQLTNTLLSAQLGGSYSNAMTFNNSKNFFFGTFVGDGSGLTNLNASSLTSGIVPGSQLAGDYGNPLTFSNSANSFSGDGRSLINLNAAQLAYGTVPNGRLSGTYRNAITFNNSANDFSGTFDGDFSGNGNGVYDVDASNLVGELPDELLSSNVAFLNGNETFTGNSTFDEDVTFNQNIIIGNWDIGLDGSDVLVFSHSGSSPFAITDGGGYDNTLQVEGGEYCDGNEHITGDLTVDGIIYGNLSSDSTNIVSDNSPIPALNGQDILNRVVQLNISRWHSNNPKDTVHHISPNVHEFNTAFNFGGSTNLISLIDENGVELAAIQGLNQKLEETHAENAELKRQNDSLAQRLNELEAMVKQIASNK